MRVVLVPPDRHARAAAAAAAMGPWEAFVGDVRVVLDPAQRLDAEDASGPGAASELSGQWRALAGGRQVDGVGTDARTVVRAPTRCEQVARDAGRPWSRVRRPGGRSTNGRGRRWIPKQAIEPSRRGRRLGCGPSARPRRAVSTSRTTGYRPGGRDQILRDRGSIAAGELGRPSGMGRLHPRTAAQGVALASGCSYPAAAGIFRRRSRRAGRLERPRCLAARWASVAAARWRA